MIRETFAINNKSGLHVRPAGVLVKVLQPFKSSIIIRFKDKEYNAKSILGIMSACIKCGEEAEFIVDGEDEQECMKAISEAIESGLGE